MLPLTDCYGSASSTVVLSLTLFNARLGHTLRHGLRLGRRHAPKLPGTRYDLHTPTLGSPTWLSSDDTRSHWQRLAWLASPEGGGAWLAPPEGHLLVRKMASECGQAAVGVMG